MKKIMVYIVALALVFSALLSGCGENNKTDGVPKHTAVPETTLLPDVEDGIVNDQDGIITEDDNGTVKDDMPIHAGNNDMDPGVSMSPEGNAAGNNDSGKTDSKHFTRP